MSGSGSSSSASKNKFDGTVDIGSIKEIRPGKSSKDFTKWSEESNNVKAARCFVVFYGNEFNLKTLSGMPTPSIFSVGSLKDLALCRKTSSSPRLLLPGLH